MNFLPGGQVTTDNNGYYKKSVTAPWTGTVTPTKQGYTFSPASKPYTNVKSDQKNQNYTATFKKTEATVILGNLTQTYAGSPLAPTATTVPAGLTIVWTGAPQTSAGSYPVTATVNDPNYQGSASGTFVIEQASSTTTVICGPGPFIYNGSAQTPCTAAVTGAGDLNQSLTVNYTNNTNAGTATASASFPGDANHTGSSDSKNFTIDKATPVITWENPADITYPTALGDAQLNATANVPGSFVYDPPSCGAPLNPGNGQTLTVTFTPDDININNYNIVSATVVINVLTPYVSKEQIGDSWICTQSDASGYPVAMYRCNNSDCSSCMTNPDTNPNRCANSSLSGVQFPPETLKWAGPGSGTVDFITSSIVYRCIEGIDLCFSCGSGTPWICDPGIPDLLSTPTVTRTAQEKIEDIWVCSEEPDLLSGCFKKVSTSLDPTDPPPCPSINQAPWEKLPLSDVAFGITELKWVGPGSDSLNCETVYFVTTSCIYKCISDQNNCFPPEVEGDPPYCCFSYCNPQ
jgi:hypothetical protein